MSRSLLDELPVAVRQAVTEAGRTRRYAKGEVVFHEGDPGDSVHVVRHGRVAVRISTPHGETVTLSVMGPGEIFGEMALFSDDHRTATVVALEDVETVALGRDSFARLRREHAAVDDLFLRVLSRRAERLTWRVAEAHFVGVDQRVARRVYEVGRLFVGDAPPVVVPLTQDDVAGLAGTTRPSANQALRKLAERGVLRLSRGRIEIVDVAALRARAGL